MSPAFMRNTSPSVAVVVARCAATALCGGDIEAGSLVDEQGLLSVELNVFLELVNNQKSQQRIQHLLDTGKPLRN